MSQKQQLSCPTKENKVSLELAIKTILNASIEEILTVLKKVPPEDTASFVIAIGRVWQGF